MHFCAAQIVWSRRRRLPTSEARAISRGDDTEAHSFPHGGTFATMAVSTADNSFSIGYQCLSMSPGAPVAPTEALGRPHGHPNGAPFDTIGSRATKTLFDGEFTSDKLDQKICYQLLQRIRLCTPELLAITRLPLSEGVGRRSHPSRHGQPRTRPLTSPGEHYHSVY